MTLANVLSQTTYGGAVAACGGLQEGPTCPQLCFRTSCAALRWSASIPSWPPPASAKRLGLASREIWTAANSPR